MNTEPSNSDRLTAIESRLTQIQLLLEIKGIWQVQNETETEKTPTTTNTPANTPTSSKVISKSKSSEGVSGQWLGIIALICFVLAAAYIIRLAVENGWLTPERQLGLAFCLGLSLIGIGLKFLESDKSYMSLLPAGGVIILFVCAFSAYGLVHILTAHAAIAAVALIATTCVTLYHRIRHDVYVLTASIGAYCAPFILDLNTADHFTQYYIFCCSLAFAFISIWMESRSFVVIAAYLGLGTNAISGFKNQTELFPVITQAIQFIIFCSATLLYSTKHKKSLTAEEAWLFFPILLFFYSTEYIFLTHFVPEAAPWISLGFATFLIAIHLLASKKLENISISRNVVSAFSAVAFFHSAYLVLLPSQAKPFLFVFLLGIMIFIKPSSMKTALPTWIKLALTPLLLILLIEYCHIIIEILDSNKTEFIPLGIISSTMMIILLLFRSETLHPFSKDKPTAQNLLLLSAHAMGISSLYRLTENIGSIAVSGAWLIYAMVILSIGFIRKDAIFARSSLLILAFSAAKVLLYDTASSGPEIRILCLLMTGAVLYICGFLLRKVSTWAKPEQKIQE